MLRENGIAAAASASFSCTRDSCDVRPALLNACAFQPATSLCQTLFTLCCPTDCQPVLFLRMRGTETLTPVRSAGCLLRSWSKGTRCPSMRRLWKMYADSMRTQRCPSMPLALWRWQEQSLMPILAPAKSFSCSRSATIIVCLFPVCNLSDLVLGCVLGAK